MMVPSIDGSHCLACAFLVRLFLLCQNKPGIDLDFIHLFFIRARLPWPNSLALFESYIDPLETWLLVGDIVHKGVPSLTTLHNI